MIAQAELPSRIDAARELLERRQGRKKFGSFLQYVWWNPQALQWGVHIQALARRLDKAIDDFENGISTYLLIQMPVRHGKSEVCSIAFTAYFLGRLEHLQPNIILSGYGADHISTFSQKSKDIIQGEAFNRLFPGVDLKDYPNTIARWGIQGSVGEVNAVSLGGKVTGKGGDLIIVDDYCKNRAAAESEVQRNSTWDSFTDDLMSRRGPTAIVLVPSTPWHVDDVAGRIKEKMKTDPTFPKFEVIRFPARSDQYETGWLFPERYSEEWYRAEYAFFGEYGSAGLLDCDPVRRGGNMFKVDRVQIHEDLSEFPDDIRYYRFWDLASTEEERVKDSPDFTAGALIGIRTIGTTPEGDPIHELWIKDINYFREEAPERDAKIRATSVRDGATVRITVERVGGYKDAYNYLRKQLLGNRVVEGMTVNKDKVIRASPLETIFEAGNVHILRGDWNYEFFRQFTEFPSSEHDDLVDSVSGGYAATLKNQPIKLDRSMLGM